MTLRPQLLARIAIGALFCIGIAHANAAMGLAFEIFELPVWFAYVATTVVFEAWLMGRGLEMSWKKSLAVSFVANLFTATCCAFSCLAPLLHPMGMDMNPLAVTTCILLIYGVFSGFWESFVWRFASGKPKSLPILGRSMLVHLLGVPLALAILLIPNRPYPGFEHSLTHWRPSRLKIALQQVYQARRTADGNSFRQFRSVKELEQALDAIPTGFQTDWPFGLVGATCGEGVGLYQPVYRRFDTYDHRIAPYQITLNEGDIAKDGWLLKIKYPEQTLVLDPNLHTYVDNPLDPTGGDR